MKQEVQTAFPARDMAAYGCPGDDQRRAALQELVADWPADRLARLLAIAREMSGSGPRVIPHP